MGVISFPPSLLSTSSFFIFFPSLYLPSLPFSLSITLSCCFTLSLLSLPFLSVLLSLPLSHSLPLFFLHLTWQGFELITRERQKNQMSCHKECHISRGRPMTQREMGGEGQDPKESTLQPPRALAGPDVFHSVSQSSIRWIFPETVLGRPETNSVGTHRFRAGHL